MVCRHRPDDPACSSNGGGSYRYTDNPSLLSPDPNKFEIIQIEEIEKHLVMMVKYPNCIKCEFEAKKVMVFLNTPLKNVIFWKKIDPHFRKPGNFKSEAPSPAARFPATDEGWNDAIGWARNKK